MTRQTHDDLHDDAMRLNPEVVEAMSEAEIPWGVEYEIPAETNGWVYYGDLGSAATTANWGDQFPAPTEAVGLIHHPTHPRDESGDYLQVHHIPDMDDKLDKELIFEVEGEPYRTPLWVRRRMFWEAVEAAIEWMEANPPGQRGSTS